MIILTWGQLEDYKQPCYVVRKIKGKDAESSSYSLTNHLRLVSKLEKCSTNAERCEPGSNA